MFVFKLFHLYYFNVESIFDSIIYKFSVFSGDIGKSLSLPVGVTELELSHKAAVTRAQSTVPSVSLTLPTSLTSETVVASVDPVSVCSSSTSPLHHPLPHHHPLTPQASNLDSHYLDPHHHPSVIYKSDSSLYPPPLYTSHPANSYHSNWNWKGQQQGSTEGSQRIPQGGPPSTPSTAHMPLTQQRSNSENIMPENPHKKLQRQLTLNPNDDSRIHKLQSIHIPNHPPPCIKTDTSDILGLPPGSGLRSGCRSPGFGSSPYGSREHLPQGTFHPPLARHSSSQEGNKTQQLNPLQSQLYPSYSHPNVTRFYSAPDSIAAQHANVHSGLPHMSRLNSTSDTKLNTIGYGSESNSTTSSAFDGFTVENQICNLINSTFQAHQPLTGSPSAPSPGPIGSRPMSPQQPPPPSIHQTPGPPHSLAPPHQHLSGSSLAHLQTFNSPVGSSSSLEDQRLKVFYHLSQLFPEAQVRAALARNPDETDPLKICSSIIQPTPGPIGSRPMSPQQVSGLSTGLSVRGGPGHASYVGPTNSLEDTRMRVFYHLSKLFPEELVRAVLARCPEETDSKKLCSMLVNLNLQS